jgi:hypothetical protein
MIKNNIILTQAEIQDLNQICYDEIICKAETAEGVKIFSPETCCYVEPFGIDSDIIALDFRIEAVPEAALLISGTKYSEDELVSMGKLDSIVD